MGALDVLVLLFALATKHLICDFFLQFPRHYKNKGFYGRWGGIEHALIHGVGTFIATGLILGWQNWRVLLIMSFIDFIVHYHVDWAKMKLNRKTGWGPTTHEQFWWAVGVDQYLHTITYIFLVWTVV